MLSIRPNVSGLRTQIEAFRTQILALTDDPAAIAELDRRINAMQAAADAFPAAQQAISNLQTALEQAVRQEQMDNVATTDMVGSVRQMVEAIKVPDTSALASKESVSQLAARIPDTSGLAPKSQFEAVASQVAAIKVPTAATEAPPKTDLVEQVGSSERYAREDHTHKARIKRATVTIGSNGYATWTFTEPFASVPVVSHMVQEQAGANRVNVIITSVSETSVTVYADRLRNLPVLNPVAGGLTALLSAVITSVNGLVTALSGFNLSGGPTSAIGVKVHLMAAEPTSN